jgi:fumarate hydratase class II
MPKEIIEVLRILKAAAYANCDLGVLPIEKRDALQLFAMKYWLVN